MYFIRVRSQQQTVYNSIHLFLTPCAHIFMPYTLINQAQTSPVLLAKAMFECPQHTCEAKNIYNPKSKMRLLLFSFIAIMLVVIQGENKRKQSEEETNETNRMVKLEFFFFFKTILIGHILKKKTHSFFGAWSFLPVHI